jgi:hypothetical protein
MSEQAPRAGLLDVLKAVFWSFLGIRKRAALEADAVRLSPVQVIVAGIAAAIVFVLCLVAVVHVVISHAGK